VAHVKVRIQELGRGELLAEVSFDLPDVNEQSLTEKLRFLFSEFVFPEGEIGRQLRAHTNVVALRQHSPLTLVGVRQPRVVPSPLVPKGVAHKGNDEYQQFYLYACEALADLRVRLGKDAFHLSETQINRDRYLKVFEELRKLPDGELRVVNDVSRALKNSEEGRSEPKQEEFVGIIRSIIAARDSLRGENRRLNESLEAAAKEKKRADERLAATQAKRDGLENQVRALKQDLELLKEKCLRDKEVGYDAPPSPPAQPPPAQRPPPRYKV
jgi:hypothetical protein